MGLSVCTETVLVLPKRCRPPCAGLAPGWGCLLSNFQPLLFQARCQGGSWSQTIRTTVPSSGKGPEWAGEERLLPLRLVSSLNGYKAS